MVASPVTLTLPALTIPDAVTPTLHGDLVVPGFKLPERIVTLDPDLVNRLLGAAHAAAAKAHAPFSNFHVGAAVIMQDDAAGTVFTGANVENSSYGGTLCAERTALATAAAAGFRRIRYLAVSVRDALAGPLCDRSPCGLCRQFIREFCDPQAPEPGLIFVQDAHAPTQAQVLDIERLLPWGFRFTPPNGQESARTARSA